MDLTTQAGTNAAINAAQAKGQQQQQMLDTQSAQAQGQYTQTYNQAQQDRAQANAAQQALAGYNVQKGGDLYNQYLTSAQQQYGFDPTALAGAQKNLLATQTAMQYAPQAAQQAGNYYGATAGQASQAYQNMAQNLNTTLANQTNKVNTFQNLLNATQAQAQAQTGAETTTQGQKISQLQSSAQNATSIFNAATEQMKTSGQIMTAIEKLQQDQGFATAQQVSAYQGAYNDYMKAQAAKTAAQGALLSGQGSLLQGQAAMGTFELAKQQVADLKAAGTKNTRIMYDSAKGQSNILNPTTNQSYTPLAYAAANGKSLLDMLALLGDPKSMAARNFMGNDGKFDPSKINQSQTLNINGQNVNVPNSQIYQYVTGQPPQMNQSQNNSNSYLNHLMGRS
jgi:hypothetical protein